MASCVARERRLASDHDVAAGGEDSTFFAKSRRSIVQQQNVRLVIMGWLNFGGVGFVTDGAFSG